MSINDLKKIEAMLGLKYQKSRKSISAIAAREALLRSELKKLERQAMVPFSDQTRHLKSIGADVIWQAWVVRMRTKLNGELALLLAQKDVLLRGVKKDFGRLTVAEEITARSTAISNKKNTQAKLQTAIDQAILLRKPR